MNGIIQEIIKHKKTCYFVSPHLDDAAFSAGGLISYLAAKTKVIVVTTFTEAGADKHSLSAQAYVVKCGYKISELDKFYSDRRKEDKDLLKSFGVKAIHLGFLDALWRKKRELNIFYKILALFLNDFRYIYPTHRLHISKGKIDKRDEVNLGKLERRLKEIVGSEKDSVVFCPLGIGKHVDHIVVREVCGRAFAKVIYWSDSPYNLYHESDKEFVKKHNLKKEVFNKNQPTRKNMFSSYKTQFKKLFNGRKDFSLLPEAYFL